MIGPGSAFVLALVLYFPSTAELGVQFTGVHLHKLDEAPFGVGARFFLNFTRSAALDSEFTHYPANPSGNFGESSVMAGVKSGWRGDRIGIFAKGRGGFWHFGGSFFDLRLNRKTIPAADLGGVLEYYPSPHTAIRIDLADTILFYGSQSLFGFTGRLGTVHNFQPGLGFSFRF
jgi:hypothetical protein